MVPIYEHIIKQIGCDIAKKIDLGDVDKLSLMPQRIIKDGKTAYSLDDKFIAIEQLQAYQGFHFHERTTRPNVKGMGSNMGVNMLGEFTFVLVDFTGIGAKKYDALHVFEKFMITGSHNGSNFTARPSWSTLNDNPVEIAQKYFPDQLTNIQKRQHEVDFLEIKYTLLFESVCNFC